MFDFDPIRILLTIPGIIIGLSCHEFAHAYMSDRLGDPTPRNQGRLTLSPLPHIDPIGLLMIVFVGFGWAKPVQINPRHYKNPRRDEILVSVAGPLTNLFLAVLFSILLKVMLTANVFSGMSESLFVNILLLFNSTIWINIILFIFNLLPLPPLDGFHILANIVSPRSYGFLQKLEQYSTIILILLIVTKVTTYIVGIPAQYVYSGIRGIVGF